MSEEGLTYKSAVAELEGILRRIEEDGADLDTLASEVERAATLIKWCRARIRATEAQIRDVVAELDEESA